jgi:hypothetical protein
MTDHIKISRILPKRRGEEIIDWGNYGKPIQYAYAYVYVYEYVHVYVSAYVYVCVYVYVYVSAYA